MQHLSVHSPALLYAMLDFMLPVGANEGLLRLRGNVTTEVVNHAADVLKALLGIRSPPVVKVVCSRLMSDCQEQLSKARNIASPRSSAARICMQCVVFDTMVLSAVADNARDLTYSACIFSLPDMISSLVSLVSMINDAVPYYQSMRSACVMLITKLVPVHPLFQTDSVQSRKEIEIVFKLFLSMMKAENAIVYESPDSLVAPLLESSETSELIMPCIGDIFQSKTMNRKALHVDLLQPSLVHDCISEILLLSRHIDAVVRQKSVDALFSWVAFNRNTSIDLQLYVYIARFFYLKETIYIYRSIVFRAFEMLHDTDKNVQEAAKKLVNQLSPSKLEFLFGDEFNTEKVSQLLIFGTCALEFALFKQ